MGDGVREINLGQVLSSIGHYKDREKREPLGEHYGGILMGSIMAIEKHVHRKETSSFGGRGKGGRTGIVL